MTDKIAQAALQPYLPATVWNWYADQKPGAVHSISEHEGIIACIDASGFTALTRRLADQGREGPEVLTRILNAFFGQVSEVVFGYGGDILKFAGDAVWVFFDDSTSLPGLLNHIVAAVDKVNQSEPALESSPLRVHIGAERGRFHLVSLGRPDERLEAEPAGKLIDQVYYACDLASDSQLVAGPRLARTMSDQRHAIRSGDGFLIINDSEADPAFPAADSLYRSEAGRGDLISKYVSQEILARLDRPGANIQSEYRQVVTLFANIQSLDQDPTGSLYHLQARTRQAMDLINACRGTLTRIDPFKSGHKMLVLFGTPIRYEQYRMDAIKCAMELSRLSDRRFRIRLGLSQGALFCGDVGAPARREYTVMGDGINLAARLMASADWGGVLLGDNFRRDLGSTVVTRQMTGSFKGVGDQVTCHRLLGVAYQSPATKSGGREQVWVGQSEPLVQLTAASRKAMTSEPVKCLLYGRPGVGKTGLLSRLTESVGETPVVAVSCRNAALFEQGWVARRLLQELHNHFCPQGDFSTWLNEKLDERWAPLLSPLTPTTSIENYWTRGLTPELRLAKAGESYAGLLADLIDRPTVIAIDDCHRADDFSQALLKELTVDSLPAGTLFIETVTGSSDEIASEDSDGTTIEVTPPSDEQWWQFFDTAFDSGKRERDLFAQLLAASEGNPRLITEFIERCRQDGTIEINSVTGRMELVAATVVALPEDITAAGLMVFDRLPESTRQSLKAASIVSGPFESDLLAHILDDLSLSEAETALGGAAQASLISGPDSDRRWVFEDFSLAEAIRSCIPMAQRRKWHSRCAAWMSDHGETPARLAYHYGEADEAARGYGYALTAARGALAQYALNEAARFFGYCRRWEEHGAADLPTSERLKFMKTFTSFLVLEGKYQQSYRWLRRWRRLARSLSDVPQTALAAVETAEVLWKQSRYERARYVLERLLPVTETGDGAPLRARVTSLLAEVERRASNFDRARDWAEQAARAARQAGDVRAEADALNKQGLALWGEGRLGEAGDCYRRSIEIGSEQGNRYDQAKSSNNLAIIKWEQGHFLEADRLFEEAVEVFRDTGDRRNEAYASGNRASLQKTFGCLENARRLFDRADQIFVRLDDRHAHFYTVGNLGDVDVIYGRLEAARTRFEQAMEFARSVDDRELEAECLARQGEVKFFTNDWDEAEVLYSQAIALSEEIGSAEYLIRSNVGLARLQIGRRQSKAALATIDTIAGLAETNAAILAHNEAVFLRGEHGRISDRPGDAVEHYQQVLKYARSQSIFELTVKSAARIAELDRTCQSSMLALLARRATEFDRDNGPGSWQTVVSSQYLVFFADILKLVNTPGPLDPIHK